MAIPKYDFDKKTGKITALNAEAQKVLDQMERPREESVREATSLREAETLGPGWTRTRVPIATPNEQSQAASWRALGFSNEEARVAAGGGHGNDAGSGLGDLRGVVRQSSACKSFLTEYEDEQTNLKHKEN